MRKKQEPTARRAIRPAPPRQPSSPSDVAVANAASRRALGTVFPARAWMVSGGGNNGNGGGAGDDSIATATATAAAAAAAAASHTRRRLQKKKKIAPAQAPSVKQALPPPGPVAPEFADSPVQGGPGQGESPGIMHETITRMEHVLQTAGDRDEGNRAEMTVDVAVDDRPHPYERLELISIINDMHWDISQGGDSFLGRPLCYPLVQDRYRLQLTSLWHTQDVQLRSELADAASATRHRYDLLCEAVNHEDYFYLLLEQGLFRSKASPDDTPLGLGPTLQRLASFFLLDDQIHPAFQACCLRMPLSRLLASEGLSELGAARVDLLLLLKHLKDCTERLAETWPGLEAACRKGAVLPLSQDLWAVFRFPSRILQRAMFGELLRALGLPGDDFYDAQKTFVETQDKFFLGQLYSPEKALRMYERYNRLVVFVLATGKKALPGSDQVSASTSDAGNRQTGDHMPNQAPPRTTHKSEDAISTLHLDSHFFTLRDRTTEAHIQTTHRLRLSALLPSTMAIRLQKSPDANVFVSQIRLGPSTVRALPFQQTYQFVVSASEHDALAKKKTDEKGVEWLVYQADQCGIRLRMCKSGPEKSWPTVEWLQQEAVWPSWAYVTINGQALGLPYKSYDKVRPYEITDLVRLGINTLELMLNRHERVREDPGLAIAVELVSCERTSEVISGVTARQTIPARDVKETLKRRLAPSQGDDEDLVVMTGPTLTISLVEPMSQAKIFDIPTRTKDCKHDQAFDLPIFLESRPNQGDSKLAEAMKCPICRADARPGNLIVDGFLIAVREELAKQGRLDVRAITVDQDGEWKMVEEAETKSPSATGRPGSSKKNDKAAAAAAVVVVDLDDD